MNLPPHIGGSMAPVINENNYISKVAVIRKHTKKDYKNLKNLCQTFMIKTQAEYEY